jgi:hypothetical protein
MGLNLSLEMKVKDKNVFKKFNSCSKKRREKTLTLVREII